MIISLSVSQNRHTDPVFGVKFISGFTIGETAIHIGKLVHEDQSDVTQGALNLKGEHIDVQIINGIDGEEPGDCIALLAGSGSE